MLDFLRIETSIENGSPVLSPTFSIQQSEDLMIRGKDFYAVWVEERGLWSTNEQDVINMIDDELRAAADNYETQYGRRPKVKWMGISSTRSIQSWHTFCQKDSRDQYHPLDENLTFIDSPPNKKAYASKRLAYALSPGDCPAFKRMMSVLYTEPERHKLEWAIGAIFTGDATWIQKFIVLYGAAGTGKSTVLNVIQKLFDGYYAVFDAKALGSASSSFALEPFKTNPLVAIQHDGDLSKIEDNTRLNSLVSHEEMTVNEKFKATYPMRFRAFLFMGTNRPVKITDAKSGLLRRLIDVTPSGERLASSEYRSIVKRIDFELGEIANYCMGVYRADPDYYDNYVPLSMMGASNDFYNFVMDSYHVFAKENRTTLKQAWAMYGEYCELARVPYPLTQRVFREELKNYFVDFGSVKEDDGSITHNVYSGFRTEIFDRENLQVIEPPKPPAEHWLNFSEDGVSVFDEEARDYPAQYAVSTGRNSRPNKAWSKSTTVLADIDTSKLHFVKVPLNHIVIDFDIPGPDGEKCLEKNIEEAKKWPPTYAELSKSGQGIHLHYIYTGDPLTLSRVYDDRVEIKVFNGDSSLRRMLTKFVNLPIASLGSGLPLKGDAKVLDFKGFKSEKALRTLIKRNLNKEIHSSTKQSIDFIYKILNEAYDGGLVYDVTDLRNDVYAFATQSTHNSDYCIKLVQKMKFQSEKPELALPETDENTNDIVFFDVEVFPNLFLINWKKQGDGKSITRMINPTPSDVEQLLSYRLIGFNNRKYDNHILYARLLGYDNQQLYELSQRLITSKKGSRHNGTFSEAYRISYTDIYDFASAANRKSLKKWEIELGIHHQELALPWDQPVPEERWVEVAEYCDNDVLATEAVFNHLRGDWVARQVLASLAGGCPNDTTNTLTAKVIFGENRSPQAEFHYRNLALPVTELDSETEAFLKAAAPEMMSAPHGEANSLLPYFEGYTYEYGKSIYRGEEVGEGGYVYAEPGMYWNVALLDVASMHPHSGIAECVFGPKFTKRFRELVNGRVSIKHEDWKDIDEILDGKLAPFIQQVQNGELKSKELANALKTAINSVYGLTSAKFDNPFRDLRNVDNIIAKRGALFMIDLKTAVQARGFTVAHIKTDSIKIPNATPEIIQFVMDFGKRYGYTFEHEATYERMCLVNDAVYIAKYAPEYEGGSWTATGKQFAVPFVFKTLFSKEPIEFEDMCETFSVSDAALYIDANETLPEGEHNYNFVGRVGAFTPVLPGHGGGDLLRGVKEEDGTIKYSSASGAKGYHWLESEYLRLQLDKDAIDLDYYRNLVDKAVDKISEYGDFEEFVNADPPKIPPWTAADGPGVDLPWYMACGKTTCQGCPSLTDHGCLEGHDISDYLTEAAADDLFVKR